MTAASDFPCMDCGTTAYSGAWSAPNDLWNRVVGSPDGFLCPNCFTLRGDSVLDRPVWDLTSRTWRPIVSAEDYEFLKARAKGEIPNAPWRTNETPRQRAERWNAAWPNDPIPVPEES